MEEAGLSNSAAGTGQNLNITSGLRPEVDLLLQKPKFEQECPLAVIVKASLQPHRSKKHRPSAVSEITHLNDPERLIFILEAHQAS